MEGIGQPDHAGANGAGKTTLLDIPVLLGDLLRGTNLAAAFMDSVLERGARAGSLVELPFRSRRESFVPAMKRPSYRSRSRSASWMSPLPPFAVRASAGPWASATRSAWMWATATHSPIVPADRQLPDLITTKLDRSGAVLVTPGPEHPRLAEWKGAIDLGSLFASGIFE